jgi:hypothetical protein
LRATVRADYGGFEIVFLVLFAALVWLGFGLRNYRLWALLIYKQAELVTHN